MELFRALAIFAEPPGADSRRAADALELGPLPAASDYTELFLFQLYPYASVYLGTEGMLGGEARDRVAGFWRALGLPPPAEPDHLALMLALYAQLAQSEDEESAPRRRALWRGARRAFLWEHLLSWLPAYLTKLMEVATPFYRRWGELLLLSLLEEAQTVGKQEELSLHLREATHSVDDPRQTGGDRFFQSLLSPVRSGMVLVRADLARAARQLGGGLRMGERMFVLKALFGYDASGALDWLREEAVRWSALHRRQHQALGEVAKFWESKTDATATLLAELKLDAGQASASTLREAG